MLRSIRLLGLYGFRRNVSTVTEYRLPSTDIYSNLAFETWLHESNDWSDQAAIMFWRNDPCVVVGSHQNPWVECNLEAMHQDGIRLARRKSGGGTVYHDLGNLNISFLTSREKHDPEFNARIVGSVLRKVFQLEADITPRRSDIFVKGHKISGSAFRLKGNAAYHHCTLLLNADVENIRRYLRSPLRDSIESRGIESVRSPVTTLEQEIQSHLTHRLDQLTDMISLEYKTQLQAKVFTRRKQDTTATDTPWYNDVLQLQSWSWKYGHSPVFTYKPWKQFAWGSVVAEVKVKKGVITDFSLTVTSSKLLAKQTVQLPIGHELVKARALVNLEGALSTLPPHMSVTIAAWVEQWPLWTQP
eukprot:m.88124 g.88124  ORF g.88124 m.88124 type:complete len:358 (+) comp14529_c0_seq2:125-1198(+)